VSVCKYIYIYAYTQTHTYTRTYTHKDTHVHSTQRPAHTLTRVLPTPTLSFLPRHPQARADTCISAKEEVDRAKAADDAMSWLSRASQKGQDPYSTNKYTYVYTYVCTYIHVHTYEYTCVCVLIQYTRVFMKEKRICSAYRAQYKNTNLCVYAYTYYMYARVCSYNTRVLLCNIRDHMLFFARFACIHVLEIYICFRQTYMFQTIKVNDYVYVHVRGNPNHTGQSHAASKIKMYIYKMYI